MSVRLSAILVIAAAVPPIVVAVAGESPPGDGAFATAGVFTVDAVGADAYSRPALVLTTTELTVFLQGKEQFHEAWVVAPDPGGVWGLGPTFNEDRCAHCHENNGRARSIAEDEVAERGMLVRLSIPGHGSEGGPLLHPAYGDQLQNRGVAGRVPAEGQVAVRYERRDVAFEEGERISLRSPVLVFHDLRFGELGPETMTSARIAPAMIGLGLLESVPESVIVEIARAQPAQGVSGKPNYVRDLETGGAMLGRFGWKANQPNVKQQVAAAFHADIGATSFLFPEENCPASQAACLELPSASKCGGQGGCTGNMFRPEVVPSRLNNITLYLQGLGVPARRNPEDPQVRRGEALFAQARCAVCHVPTLTTGEAAIPAASNLAFHPYTDLLLHEMGEDLADGRPDFLADGSEWRTAPLWGLGLLREVNDHLDLLHDGRARGVAEAILWHGGEAEQAREAFRRMPKVDREALVRFVESL